jgi:hypothetical protein
VAIYSNDHPPPHVHAIGRDGARARFGLNCQQGPVRLVEQSGFRPADVIEVGSAIAAALTAVCAPIQGHFPQLMRNPDPA